MPVTFVLDGREPWAPVRIDSETSVITGAVIEVRDEPDLDCDVDIHVRYDESSGRTLATQVIVKQRLGGPEVTSRMLRYVRVREYIEQQEPLITYTGSELQRYRDSLAEIGKFGEGNFALDLESLISTARDDASWEDLKYRWAFRAYRWAQLAGRDDPAKQAAEHLGVSTRTVSRWINKARELGYFD